MKFWLGVSMLLFTSSLTCDEVAYLPGDLSIGGLFSIYQPSDNKETDFCGSAKISSSSVVELEAVKWSLKQLNEIDYVPGVKLGMLAFPTCRSKEQAALKTNNFINLMQKENQTYNLVGLIGPSHSSEAETVSSILSSLPNKYRIPQIGYATTSESLGDRIQYPNFFRTIPSDTVQMKAISSLLVSLEWNLIHIIYENDTYGKSGAKVLTEEATRLGICIPVTTKIEIENWKTIDLQLSNAINESLGHSINGVVFIGGERMAKELMKIVDKHNVLNTPAFILSEAVQSVSNVFIDNNRIINASKGALLMSPTKNVVNDFRNYWISLFTNTSKLIEESSSNPWLPEVYEEFSGCEYSNTSCLPVIENDVVSHISESVFITYAIKAVFTLAKALKIIQSELCESQPVPCETLRYFSRSTVIKALEDIKVDFKLDFPLINLPTALSTIEFDQNGNVIYRSGTPVYEVYNYRTCLTKEETFCPVRVATFEDGDIALNRNYLKDYDINGKELLTFRKANCPIGNICSTCLAADESTQMFYIPGDLIIITTFPIHDKGSDALACSEIRSNIGLDIALTAKFVMEKIKQKTGIFKNRFPNHSIGLLLIDGCNEPLVIRNKVLSLCRSESFPGLPDNIRERIIGFIGSLGSTPTVALAEVSSNLHIPHVGCCSTSPTLSDRKEYPYFARVSTPVNQNAEVMVSIADKLGAKYIQVVYSEGEYGESGKNAIVDEAKKRHICIAQIIKIVENVDKIYNETIPALRKYPDARFVLFILRSHVSPEIIKSYVKDTKSYAGEFQFIASETWGTRDVYKDRKLIGSITVAQEMAQSDEYLTWLSNQLPIASDQNKWLQSFMEKRFDCYFSWSFNKQRSRQCDDNDRLPGDNNQILDPWTPYLLNAQLALLIGADDAIKQLCPNTKDKTLCSNYLKNPGLVMEYIKKVKLDLSGIGRDVEVFDEYGNGVYGYKIYNLHSNLEYEKVGEGIPGDIDLKINGLEFPSGENIPSNCLKKEECEQCFTGADTNNLSCSTQETGSSVLFAVIGILTVLLVIVILLFIICLKKAREMTDSPYLDPTDYGPYLTTSDSEIFRRNQTFSNDDEKVQKAEET